MQGQDATGIDERSKYYIENIFEELDAPGEWYYDNQKGVLYAIPEPGINLNKALIEISCLKQVNVVDFLLKNTRMDGTRKNSWNHYKTFNYNEFVIYYT